MSRFFSWKIPVIIVVTLLLAFFDLPFETQKSIIPFTPDSFQSNKIHLGLDLQGGSQLDYKIDLRNVPEADQESIVEGVKTVIEKRVNGLGVAEPNIYIADVGTEKHIVVELAENTDITQTDVDTYLGEKKNLSELTADEKEIVSLEKAKATVGKTIQLEFKEEKGALDPQEKDKIRSNAQAALDKIKAGKSFEMIGQEEQQAYPGKAKYEKSEYLFEDKLPAKIKESVLKLKIGEFTKELIETGGNFTIDPTTGKTIEDTGLAIIKLTDKKEEVKNEKEVSASHILIAFTGADGADASVTRTEDEAYTLAKEIKAKLDKGESFATLAKENSNDKSNSDLGGKLITPISGDGTYVYDFEQAGLKLTKAGELSEIVKTQFGYHIIKADDVKENVKYPQYQYESITYSTVPDPWKDTGLTGKQFVHADVQLDKFYQPYIQIQFNEEGAKLFEEITGRNVNKPVAIFVGGNLISWPKVNEKIVGGNAVIEGSFTNEEAKDIAMNLNTGAIPAPIVLAGEYTLGATLGQEALSQSLMAGMIGLLLVMLFMMVFYKLAGLLANIALVSYAAILLFLIKSQLSMGLAIGLSLVVFIFLVVKIITNKDSGWEKLLSFVLSCFAFFFLAFLLKAGVVLTVAGIAGIVISVGMAVDANVLIFERFKEEIKDGKSFSAAIDSSFDRAWSAIRDSNFSTLLTCAILFFLGSSTIKGFAFNLSAGILVSMFTAITITRALLQGFIGKKIAQNVKLFGVTNRPVLNFGFIKNSKLWLKISGTLVAISIIGTIVFGLNLGLDFTGGTLLEFKFKEPVTKETLTKAFTDIEKEMNETLAPVTTETATQPTTEKDTAITGTSKDDKTLSNEEPEKIDLTKIQIIESGEFSYIVKTKYMTSEIHDKVIAKMKERLPNFTEPRFTTIGPTVGGTMLNKAIIAVIVAMVMIILYVAFAFRKMPKEVNPWRFGVAAIVALIHDVIIMSGVFIFLGYFLNAEMDALFITAILTVLGYSVNDSIVIFDRIRENVIKGSVNESLDDVTNRSLNETFSRSINTTATTLIALLAILIWGSSSIFYFALALSVGIFFGAYSSIFVASPIIVYWNRWAKNRKD